VKSAIRSTLLSVLALFAVGNIALNVIAPANAAVSRPLSGSETDDPGNLADAAGESEDVTVYGAALGDFCIASFSLDVTDVVMTCNVTAANVATVRYQNETTGAVNLAEGTLRVQVIRPSIP
jgi:hypothetical protein